MSQKDNNSLSYSSSYSDHSLLRKDASRPVDNSEVETLCKSIQGKIKREWFNPFAAYKKSLVAGHNRDAILHALRQIDKVAESAGGNLWGYYNRIIQLENMNYNERDHTRKAEEFKPMRFEFDGFVEFLKQRGK